MQFSAIFGPLDLENGLILGIELYLCGQSGY